MSRDVFIRSVSFVISLALITSFAGCTKSVNNTASGALAGSALGAGLGAIIGNQSGKPGAGVAIGAAAGALGGALMGQGLDRREAEAQRVRERLEAQRSQIAQNRILIEELRKRGADVRPSERGVVVNLPDILFEFDKSNLTPHAHQTLEEISTVLLGVQGRIIAVEGHTDSIGTTIYNKKLSENRARSVYQKLEQMGVPRTQMMAKGFGEGAPIATNNTEVGRARNRRVEIIVEN